MTGQDASSIDSGSIEMQSNPRLHQAFKKAKEDWFPVNPKLLQRIHLGLASGAYDLDVEFLINEIKTDFALFTYCLKEISQKRQEGVIKADPEDDPITIMRTVGFETLKEILSVKGNEISQYDGKKMDEMQAMRLQESMVSASTAEILSDRQKINPGFGFATGLLRQLGLTLIAWNYPKVYQETISTLSEESSLDDELTRKLGFSPKLLGMSVSRQWGLAPAIQSALSNQENPTVESGMPKTQTESKAQQTHMAEVVNKLDEICEIGEALARANNPEHYPSAQADWEKARIGIEESLGHAGMKLIQERVKENCENYATLVPKIFKRTVEPEARMHRYRNESVFKRNQYVRNCPKHIQHMFVNLYRTMDPGKVTKENIRHLAEVIIPAMGFSRGCIYLLDPATMNLVPRLKIGESNIKDFKVIHYGESVGTDNPILKAYSSEAPISSNKNLEGGTMSSRPFIAGVVGVKHQAGVLYLDVSERLMKDPSQVPLVLYKAISVALNDVLNLR